jgi:hypothetical protein
METSSILPPSVTHQGEKAGSHEMGKISHKVELIIHFYTSQNLKLRIYIRLTWHLPKNKHMANSLLNQIWSRNLISWLEI